jgi:hypothetical protein
LLKPTFNKHPIKANSSYGVTDHGIIHEPVTRHLEMLEDKEIKIITNITDNVYKKALENSAHIAQ